MSRKRVNVGMQKKNYVPHMCFIFVEFIITYFRKHESKKVSRKQVYMECHSCLPGPNSNIGV